MLLYRKFATPTAAWTLATALGSGALLYAATGLHPLAGLTWFALVPVLVVAPRVSTRAAAAAAFGAWFIGGANLWTYLSLVGMPVPLIVGYAILPALLFVGFVVLFRTLLVRGRPLLAVVATPAVWAAVEYLFSVLTPDGAFWSLAYTQSDLLAVMQTVSLTGPWGVTYLVVGAATAIATVTTAGAVTTAGIATIPGIAAAGRLRAAAVYGALLVAALGYGTARLVEPAPTTRVTVALVAADQPGGRLDLPSDSGRMMLDGYVREVRQLAGRGVQIAVLPETVFAVADADLADQLAPLRRLADETGITVVIGIATIDDPATSRSGWNTAQIFSPHAAPAVYRKQHLITGAESKYRPGHDLAVLPGGGPVTGVQICKDLDFPALTRSYGRGDAAMIVAPAHDFGRDGWLHGRIAITRGIENGISIARSPRDGRMTMTDSRGRVLADADTSSGVAMVVAIAEIPVATGSATVSTTVYGRAGDWFAWLSLAVLVGLVGLMISLRRKARVQARLNTGTSFVARVQRVGVEGGT